MEHITLMWRPVLEVAILWFVIYTLFLFIKGTRTVQVLKGLIILGALFIITQWLGLESINWILTKLFAISVIAFFIIFQPELRRGLARLGQFGIVTRQQETFDEVVKAAAALANKKVGGLIALQREVGLRSYVESGVSMGSEVSSELINTLFMPNTPLHDGGLIIEEDRIVAAGCLFPISHDPRLSKSLGTRHRAAIGLSEETDAVVIVVSEETGVISLAVNGHLTRNISREELARSLNNLFRPKHERQTVLDVFDRFLRRQ